MQHPHRCFGEVCTAPTVAQLGTSRLGFCPRPEERLYRASQKYLPAVGTKHLARASNLPVQTQTLVLAISGWSELSSLYVNPGGIGDIRITVSSCRIAAVGG
jgi:hypothetical protein